MHPRELIERRRTELRLRTVHQQTIALQRGIDRDEASLILDMRRLVVVAEDR